MGLHVLIEMSKESDGEIKLFFVLKIYNKHFGKNWVLNKF
jgi:hypothetical protein